MAPRETTVAELNLALVTGDDVEVALSMDEDAFRGFYERTARPLVGYLTRLTGDRSAADDLMQDTYYRFLRATVRLETDAHRRHYLFRIATNLAADRGRRQRSRPQLSDQQPDRIADGSTDTQMNRRLDLETAMSRLRVRERAMIWLAYTQGASHEEIARIVGVRTGSIKPLPFRARRKLAELLGPSSKGGAQ